MFPQLHNVGNSLKNLWELLDTPYVDRQLFSHISSSTSLDDISSTPGSLAIIVIDQVRIC